MTEPSQPAHDQTLHRLHHEIKNCLSVIAMGAETLKRVKGDDSTFNDICDRIENQTQAAALRLNEFLHATCDACGSKLTETK